MSENSVDKDKTALVNYEEVLKAFAVSSVVSLVAGPIGILGASGWFLREIYKARKSGKASKPTADDIDTLCKIIEIGREQGLSELVIEMADSIAANIDFGVAESLFEGVRIGLGGKVGTLRKIHIKYQDMS